MASLWNFFRKQEPIDASATVAMVSDMSTVQYPDDNYLNFAKEGYGKSELVHACIRELSTGVANGRWYVGVQDDGGITELEDTPLANLIKYPHPTQDFGTWIQSAVTYLQVAGNLYVYKERSQTNDVIALWLLRPDRISIIPQDRGMNRYSYEMDGVEYELPTEDVGHMALPNPNNDVYGLSPLHVISKTINLDMAMTDFAKTYFQNAGVPSGLLKIKRRLTSAEEATRIRSRWRSTFGGTRNMHQVAVLDDDAEYQQMASAPKDMALTELRDITESRICSVLGVPPILISANVGLQRSTFANYREARFSFHSETLEPLINQMRQFLNYCLTPNFLNDGKVMVDLSEMRSFLDDKDSVTSRATALFSAGIITLNEARTLVGQDAVDDGDVRRVPINVMEEADALSGGSRALNEGNKTVHLKAEDIKASSDNLRGATKLRLELLRDRDNLVNDAERSFERYLTRILNRADGVLGRYMERGIPLEEKAFPFDWNDLVPDAEASELGELLYQTYMKVSKLTFQRINEAGIAGSLDWDEKLKAVTEVTTQSATRANMIHGTTKKRVQEQIRTALERGYSVEQLARGVPTDKFKGIRAELGETKIRARLIARTEVMRSQNQTSIGFYREQGFDFLKATDPDGGEGDNYVDPGDPYGRTCIERDGQVYHASDAMNISDHPNGTLSWQPMDRNYQMEEVLA